MTPDDQATINLLGLRLPWKATTVIILSTLLLIVDYYYQTPIWTGSGTFGARLLGTAYFHLILYLVIPMAVVLLAFRERPAAYGFTLGKWREGVKWTLIVWAAAIPILYFAGRTPDMVLYYARYDQPLGQMLLTNALELFSWEFFFRGFILFALLRVAGPSAVVLQAVPFAMAHVGKPFLETISTIFGGTLFGWVAWRSESFLYSFFIHWFIMSFVVVVALMAFR